MAEPRVSVLVTAYQHERYIARALDGVLEQRDVAFELIVGDEDGSRPDARFTGPGPERQVGLPELLDGCQIGSCAPLVRRDAIHPLPDWYVDLPWGDADAARECLAENLRLQPFDPRRLRQPRGERRRLALWLLVSTPPPITQRMAA